jgi:hypothetical protein
MQHTAQPQQNLGLPLGWQGEGMHGLEQGWQGEAGKSNAQPVLDLIGGEDDKRDNIASETWPSGPVLQNHLPNPEPHHDAHHSAIV